MNKEKIISKILLYQKKECNNCEYKNYNCNDNQIKYCLIDTIKNIVNNKKIIEYVL